MGWAIAIVMLALVWLVPLIMFCINTHTHSQSVFKQTHWALTKPRALWNGTEISAVACLPGWSCVGSRFRSPHVNKLKLGVIDLRLANGELIKEQFTAVPLSFSFPFLFVFSLRAGSWTQCVDHLALFLWMPALLLLLFIYLLAAFPFSHQHQNGRRRLM